MESKKQVVIAGAGQLGSRYLQGLATIPKPLNIYVHDISTESLSRAQSRWHEAENGTNRHSVYFITDFTNLPPHIDLAIISTTSDIRPEIVETLSAKARIDYWLLEKVLATNEWGIERILELTSDAKGAWVNTPRRIMPWYRALKPMLYRGMPIELHVSGGQWGLACNSIHFIDLLSWLTSESLVRVDATGLDPGWRESKRKGYFEASGSIKVIMSGGSSASLTAEFDDKPLRIVVSAADGTEWLVDETAGIATCGSAPPVKGRISFQSELTPIVVSSILNSGTCDLPSIRESSHMHRLFLSALLSQWNRVHSATTTLPIT